ncbi:hypothetical protein QBZ16_002362 [Prototheca wickerhamii]|uniref:C3H1-type domain-containing protein n=1 Tax=Prototheca wickerhamii TaxID=3111 RepID=A0AAD9MJJ1_PROWI|nr:hypothetical protein QBZ16_002362 [Prototheca wickerhamii]
MARKLRLARVGLDKELDELLDITFIDAPNPASGPIPEDVTPFFDPPYWEWWNAKQDDKGQWMIEDWTSAMEKAAWAMKEYGPFDGTHTDVGTQCVMGFSQGGAMAHVVVGLQRSGKYFQEFPPLKFMILFAGIRLRVGSLAAVYDHIADVPSCHIIGDRDPVKQMTNYLIESFDDPLVINHTKGHVIPQLPPPDLQRLKDFIREQQKKLLIVIFCETDPAAGQGDDRRQICFDFTKGVCSRGASCKYSHSVEHIIAVNSEEKGICFDFLKGLCNRGLMCRFSHDLSNLQPPQQEANGGRRKYAPICYDFVKNQCSRGDECRYSHDYASIFYGPRSSGKNLNVICVDYTRSAANAMASVLPYGHPAYAHGYAPVPWDGNPYGPVAGPGYYAMPPYQQATNRPPGLEPSAALRAVAAAMAAAERLPEGLGPMPELADQSGGVGVAVAAAPLPRSDLAPRLKQGLEPTAAALDRLRASGADLAQPRGPGLAGDAGLLLVDKSLHRAKHAGLLASSRTGSADLSPTISAGWHTDAPAPGALHDAPALHALGGRPEALAYGAPRRHPSSLLPLHVRLAREAGSGPASGAQTPLPDGAMTMRPGEAVDDRVGLELLQSIWALHGVQ